MIAVTLIIFFAAGLAGFYPWFSYILFALIALGLFIKNRHNHNDNTSGVLGVFSIAAQAGIKDKCAFVLFDNEEWGLLGSLAFANWRRKNFLGNKECDVINLDCIGNAGALLIAVKNRHDGWHKMADFLRGEGFETVKKHSVMIYLSDHANFKRGVMLSFVKKSLIGKFLYMPRIHTSKDNVCDLENIKNLGAAVYKYICGIIDGRENHEI